MSALAESPTISNESIASLIRYIGAIEHREVKLTPEQLITNQYVTRAKTLLGK
jgi:hypothetical protein